MSGEGTNFFANSESLTLILLLIALGIFSWVTLRSSNVRTFQFQLSLFIVIWILGETVDLLLESQPEVEITGSDEIAIYFHFAAMTVFAAIIWFRFLSAKKKGKTLLDDLRDT